MEVQGLKELEKKFRNMEQKVAKKIVRSAVTKALKPTLKRAKSNALSMIGGEEGAKIADALKTKAVNKQQRGYYQKQVCIDPNKSDEFVDVSSEGKRNYIPAAIEYGHVNRDGTETAPIPYMLEAAESTAQQSIEIFKKEIKKGIDSA